MSAKFYCADCGVEVGMGRVYKGHTKKARVLCNKCYKKKIKEG